MKPEKPAGESGKFEGLMPETPVDGPDGPCGPGRWDSILQGDRICPRIRFRSIIRATSLDTTFLSERRSFLDSI